jgi:hypothetical protein
MSPDDIEITINNDTLTIRKEIPPSDRRARSTKNLSARRRADVLVAETNAPAPQQVLSDHLEHRVAGKHLVSGEQVGAVQRSIRRSIDRTRRRHTPNGATVRRRIPVRCEAPANDHA